MYKVKDSIQSFISYKPNTVEYDIKLDANESIYNEKILREKIDISTINLYPDHYAVELRKEIATYQNVTLEEVMVGNGSSELLELVVKTFVNPNDVVLSVTPSFVMYEKYTMISNGIFKTIKTNKNYTITPHEIIKETNKINPKLLFLCTPNNPTGFMLTKQQVKQIVSSVNCLVVVDEAYMEFASKDETVIPFINNYNNLIVNRTFSKAFGLAGVRLGYFITNKQLIDTLSLAKTPYAVNTLTQQIGILALNNLEYLEHNINNIKTEKKYLQENLQKLGITVYNSETNFLFCEFKELDLAEALQERRILIRNFKNGLYRITIGTKQENQKLIQELEEILNERS